MTGVAMLLVPLLGGAAAINVVFGAAALRDGEPVWGLFSFAAAGVSVWAALYWADHLPEFPRWLTGPWYAMRDGVACVFTGLARLLRLRELARLLRLP